MISTNEEQDIAAMSVADVALNYPNALGVLKKHKLDYCCGGGRSFKEACGREGVDPLLVIHEILGTRLNVTFDNQINFGSWDLPLIIDFIVQHHHRYVRTALPEINELLDKVCSAHGSDRPNLYIIKEKFQILEEELLSHLDKEEKVLFPFIARLNESPDINAGIVQNIEGPVAVMEHEHDSAGEILKAIRELSDNYTPPLHACPTYNMAFLKLSYFDDDLVQHIHIENNVLFPRAKALASGSVKKTS